MQEILANKYRPKTFDDVLGQEHVVSALKNQIKSPANVYMFAGLSGSGKTTIGRIFAKEIVKNPLSIVEVDAAQYSGVENVRKILSQIDYCPINGDRKVYILDECHKFSSEAWTTLLKTLEDTPKHVVFILCTTEATSVPETILNRVQRYDFNAISKDLIENRLKQICALEKIEYEEEALAYMASKAKGCVREAIKSLDLCRSAISEKITKKLVFNYLNHYDLDLLVSFTENLLSENSTEATKQIVNDFRLVNLRVLIKDSLELLLNYTLKEVINTCSNEIYSDVKFSKVYIEEEVKRTIIFLTNLYEKIKFDDNPQVLILASLYTKGA